MGIRRSGQTFITPGFFSVVAPKSGDTKVTVTFAANTLAGHHDHFHLDCGPGRLARVLDFIWNS